MKSLQKESHLRQKESVIAFIKLGICYFALVAFIFLLINIPKQVKSSTLITRFQCSVSCCACAKGMHGYRCVT